MCLDDLEAKLSPTTKVIMLVHWGGRPVDLDRVARIQETCRRRYGFTPAVIEDCAHAIGSEFGGRKVGNHGNICVFSLQAIKHLTSGDGGLIILPNGKLHARAKKIRWFGIDRDARSGDGDFRMEPDIAEWGYKFHMNDINATIGLANMRHLPALLERCQANARYYDEHLRGITGIELLEPMPQSSKSAWWLYTFRVPFGRRAALIAHLKQKGVMASAVHQRNDVHSCVRAYGARLPKLNVLAQEILCIPVGWWVTDADRARIVGTMRAFLSTPAEAKAREQARLGWAEQHAATPKMSTTLGALRPDGRPPVCVITGGAGFIGHHVVEHFVLNTKYDVVVLDKLSYASKGYDRLRDSGVFHQIQTFCVDLANPIPPGLAYEIGTNRVEVILHIAAETHVDNSITDPVPFVENNVRSTVHILEYARLCTNLKNFIYFSTDEARSPEIATCRDLPEWPPAPLSPGPLIAT